jgi:hypothetical protein
MPTQSVFQAALGMDMFNLLQSSSRNNFQPSLGCLKQNLQHAKMSLFGNSALAFARAAGVHHSSMHDLLSGAVRPGLETLFRISHACQQSSAEMLARNLPSSCFQRNNRAAPRRPCKKYDWGLIDRSVRCEMRKPVAVRISLNRLCKSMGLDSNYVAKRLPGLARECIIEFRANSLERHQQRIRSVDVLLTSTMTRMMESGVWPSHRKIRKALGKSICFRDPQLCRLRHELMDRFNFIRL